MVRSCLQHPPMVSVAIQPQRFTMKGINEWKEFSVNVPSVAMAAEADYCGMVSGSKTDKNLDCGFDVFYGDIKHAPYIRQFPVNIGCTVENILELGSHLLVIGRIADLKVDSECLTDGAPDMNKIKPLIYASGGSREYYGIGENIGKAFNMGRKIKEGK